jgi:Tol biopolymer transport system component
MKQLIILLAVVTSFTSCTQKSEEESFKINLNVHELIDYEPEMLAPGIISKAPFEGHATITPDGNKIYFAVYSNDHVYSTIAYSIKKGGRWTEPEIAEFSGKYRDGSPALSPDGKKLYFSSNRPINGSTINTSNDIWYVERSVSNKWNDPVRLNDYVNSSYNEFSPSIDENGNLFFCSDRPNGYGNMDVYFARFSEGKYNEPRLLDDSINSQYREGNVGVSPDGNKLFIMVQSKPGDYGYDDIHYSIKTNGQWSATQNIGSIINTYTYDFSPKISPDGKTLYFSSRINRDFNSPDSAYTYKSFQSYLKSPLNGFGNIYHIDLVKLNLEVKQ